MMAAGAGVSSKWRWDVMWGQCQQGDVNEITSEVRVMTFALGEVYFNQRSVMCFYRLIRVSKNLPGHMLTVVW